MVQLSRNDIGDITTDPFTHLFAIEKLYLGFNGMTRMPAIQSTSDTLKILYLDWNKMINVPSNYFANFSVLIELRLSGNEIREIEIDAFAGLPPLNWLFLDSNPITTFDEYAASTDGLAGLGQFLATYSSPVEFPCLGPYNIKKLKYILIRNCQISVVRRDCVDALGPGPLYITLQGNRLTSIANMSRAVPRVELLDISNNPFLNEFPLVNYSEVASANLEILKLSGTVFPVFPLVQMRHSLLEVHAAAARIECVPTTRISALSTLHIMDLSSNEMSSFPDDSCINASSDNSILAASGISSVIQFSGLQLLNLENNTLQNFPHLDTATNLITLLLSFNRILSVSYNDVAHLKSLRNLEIRDNHIFSFLAGSAISPFFDTQLRTLDLSNNHLIEIPDLSNLTVDIHLAGNALVSFGNSNYEMQFVQATVWNLFY